DYVNEASDGHFRHNAFFIGANVREAEGRGRADYTPIFLSEIPELIRSGQRSVDTVLLQLSPPDRHGYCSMGISVDIQHAALESAGLVIAEINPRMPRTHGNTSVHLSRIDCAVATDDPILELPSPGEPDAVSVEIGGHVARLIDDGSCLQLGIGAVPNAVLSFLGDKRDLGVHTEMFSDGMLPLVENGNITNARKAVHRGKTVTSFVLGSRALFDYVDDNVSVEFHPSDFVNDPRVISRNDNVISVNSALQVDLTGQVSADSIGYRFYSGIGGQVDFVRGASMSRGGKPIIALPSTAKGGTVSRIAPHLTEGAGVVTSRGDVHYVVTEYGVAYLHGKTIRERALALINIAHPDFRAELLEFVRGKHYVATDERIWEQAINRYPADWESREMFGANELTVRPLRATDERILQEFFYGHTPETVRERYFSTKETLSHREAAHLCCVDYECRMAFGVVEKRGAAERLVAVARYDLNPRTNLADIAVVVHEDRRRLGIGRFLLNRLIDYARSRKISGLRSELRPDNEAMRALHLSLGHQVVWNGEAGTYT
ncbi:MAG: GNAT family N-acetyltransferase, partial [Gemmatimonadetes bacterium]|nr:GNAT family N-acetyltransferase [Gemmatimonadota bacterium]